MNTQAMIEKAVKLQNQARTFLINRIEELEGELTFLRESLEALGSGSVEASTPSRAKSKTGRSPGRPTFASMSPNERRARAQRRAAIAKRNEKKDLVLNKLPDSFDRERFDKTGLQPIVLAHWIRGGKIKKLANGSYKRLGMKKTSQTQATIAQPASSAA